MFKATMEGGGRGEGMRCQEVLKADRGHPLGTGAGGAVTRKYSSPNSTIALTFPDRLNSQASILSVFTLQQAHAPPLPPPEVSKKCLSGRKA